MAGDLVQRKSVSPDGGVWTCHVASRVYVCVCTCVRKCGCAHVRVCDERDKLPYLG